MKSLNVLSILTVLVLVIARYSSLADLEAPVPAPVSASYAEAVAPSPVPQELALPESPETTCVGAVFHEATSEAPSCSDTMYNYKDPGIIGLRNFREKSRLGYTQALLRVEQRSDASFD